MRSNPRLFIRSIQTSIIQNNPAVLLYFRIKKLFAMCTDFPQKNSKISKNILNTKEKIEKTRSIIDLDMKDRSNLINLIR